MELFSAKKKTYVYAHIGLIGGAYSWASLRELSLLCDKITQHKGASTDNQGFEKLKVQVHVKAG